MLTGSTMDSWRPEHDGQFFQPPDAELEDRRALQAIALGEDPDLLYGQTITDYQNWVELDWKRPHGTHEAHTRFREGLIGEHIELAEEIVQLGATLDGSRGADVDATVSELGDVVWYAVALASNVGVSAEHAIRSHMHRQWIQITPEDRITFVRLDYLAASDQLPVLDSPRDFVHPDFYAEMAEGEEILSDLYYRAAMIAIAAEQIFGDNDPDTYVTDGAVWKKNREVVEPALGLLLSAAAVHSHRVLNTPLTEVIRKNIQKIGARVETGTIDRSDGRRTGDAL